MRVLIADDSETILLLLRTRLEMEGYEVAAASDGREVLGQLARGGPAGQPDLMLLDAMMPGKSGLDVLAELRAAGSDIPVVIVSAHGERSRLQAPDGIEADAYLGKPIDFDELLAQIARLTQG